MSGRGDNSNRKRKYNDHHNNHRRNNYKHRNPKRGGPGVLVTCETGREGKCRREGISILQHYFSLGLSDGASNNTSDDEHPKESNDSTTGNSTSLSLEEELKMLRSKKSSSKFERYETGSKGSVFLMCTAEGCQIIPPIHVDSDDDRDDNDKNGNETKKSKDENNDNLGDADDTKIERTKRQRTGDVGSSAEPKIETDEGRAEEKATDGSAPSAGANKAEKEAGKKVGTKPWDPVPVVRKVFAEVEQNVTSAPSSRFVTRMIPIQATCFASAAEIKATSEALLQKFFFPNENYKSFAVTLQKRICNNVKKPEIIDIIAGRILDNNENQTKKYKVSLDNPDVTIVVEIVRTLCGIAIVPRPKEMPNKFSMVIAREKAALALQQQEEE